MDSPIGGARDVGLREILLRHLGSWVRVNLSDMGELRRAAVVAVGRDCFTVYDSERTFVLSFTAVMAVSESVDADDVVVVISPLAVTHRSIRA
ncbi:hypothetical protein [Azospirillum halopraeferens]|uniref:hypothetical protein n=1 Tax=Azospirillum halopraeferens TaxID=34010 RepID=UPI0004278CF1|nr:hypothetical protein [Azospirillum halopraeferens]